MVVASRRPPRASLGTRRRRSGLLVAAGTSSPAAASARSSSSDGGGGEDDSSAGRGRPSRARAALEPGQRLAAGELLEEVLDQVLLRQPLDQLDLLERDRGLVGRARARSTSDVPVARSPSSSSLARAARRRTPSGRCARARARARRGRSRGAAPALRADGRAQVQHLGGGVEQVEGARLSAQELPRARGDGRKHGVERLARARISPSSVRCSSSSTRRRISSVEAGVLDRAGDERRARDEPPPRPR